MNAFLTALGGVRPDRLPIWFMRQAGRSLPEYRAARKGLGMLESCLRPEVAAEITLQPVRRHGVDAAILFSDIMVPVLLAGVAVDITPNVGPVLDQPYRDQAAVRELVTHDIADDSAIAETVRLVRGELTDTALIGFAGAPFTLAAYLVEGRPSRDHLAARTLMHADPATWGSLMEWCATISRRFIDTQVAAGAQAIQLFDSWAGSLSRDDYVRYVQPYSQRVLAGLDVPTIHFGTNTGHLLREFAAGSTAVGIDYRTPLDEAVETIGGRPIVQGNINPALLGAPWEVLEAHVRDVVARGRAAGAHIVNLGHGVPPTTDPDVLTRVVELVHAL